MDINQIKWQLNQSHVVSNTMLKRVDAIAEQRGLNFSAHKKSVLLDIFFAHAVLEIVGTKENLPVFPIVRISDDHEKRKPLQLQPLSNAIQQTISDGVLKNTFVLAAVEAFCQKDPRQRNPEATKGLYQLQARIDHLNKCFATPALHVLAEAQKVFKANTHLCDKLQEITDKMKELIATEQTPVPLNRTISYTPSQQPVTASTLKETPSRSALYPSPKAVVSTIHTPHA